MNLFDIFKQNLRGHDYIAARGLSPEVVRKNGHVCPQCRLNDLLPAVQQIVANYQK
jgi:hypothetical protein